MELLHSKKIASLAKELVKLEQEGRYDDAFAELTDIWTDTNELPDIDGLKPFEAAELILRCGSLIGFIGHHKQIDGFQEKSKNLLTEAHRRFTDIYNTQKIAECENYLALAYCRTGEFNEATAYVESALSIISNDDNSVKLHLIITKSFILLSTGKHQENILLCRGYAKTFENYGNPYLCGCLYTNFGVSLRNRSKNQEAIKIYNKAKKFHTKSGHQVYLATLENNLANSYKDEKCFSKAHEASDRATGIFRRIKERTREGYSLDTKASIFLVENKSKEALETINEAIGILEKGENVAYLTDAMLTKIKALIVLDKIFDASKDFAECYKILQVKISQEAADNLIREFESLVRQERLLKPVKIYTEKTLETDEVLELIIPPEIANYNDYHGVWIKNNTLLKYGIESGDLAIFSPEEKPKRGDLAVINIIGEDEVVCGIFDSEFGLICLDGNEDEPQLFDSNEVEILGKIIGFGKTTDELSNTLKINTIRL